MTTAPEERAYLLTYRQRQVLLLCANGFQSIEIAQLLAVSYYTIKRHFQRAIQVLRANDRVHAVILALRLGELDVNSIYPNDPGYVPNRCRPYLKAA